MLALFQFVAPDVVTLYTLLPFPTLGDASLALFRSAAQLKHGVNE